MVILVLPTKRGRGDAAAQYRRALSALEVAPFDEAAAEVFARLRADQPAIRPPDAIQLACAARCAADLFLASARFGH